MHGVEKATANTYLPRNRRTHLHVVDRYDGEPTAAYSRYSKSVKKGHAFIATALSKLGSGRGTQLGMYQQNEGLYIEVSKPH